MTPSEPADRSSNARRGSHAPVPKPVRTVGIAGRVRRPMGALRVVFAFGTISLLTDVGYEGALSITGPPAGVVGCDRVRRRYRHRSR